MKRNNFENEVISPNPASDYIVISNEEFGFSSVPVDIYNTFGEKVLSKYLAPGSGNNIDITGLAQGIYYITYKTKNGTHFEKFVVAR